MKIDFDVNKASLEVLKMVSGEAKKKARVNYATVSYGKKARSGHWVSKWGDPANNETMALTNTLRTTYGKDKAMLIAGGGKVDYAHTLETVLNRPNLSVVGGEVLAEKEDEIINIIERNIRFS